MTEWKQALHDHWKFKAAGQERWLEAKVPGCVHADLFRNGEIPDPFYGTNERELQWIDKTDWEYTASFDVQPELFRAQQIEIVFSGLDTYADVYLNGAKIIAADNMFRTWRADVKALLRPADNTLYVHFRSPIQEDLPKLEKLGYALPATNDQSDVGGLGENKVSVFARKAPYHYGWDWGPRLVTSGIWRNVTLIGWNEVRMTDLFIEQQDIRSDLARLSAHVEVETSAAWEGELLIATEGGAWRQTVAFAQPGIHQVAVPLTIEQPRLWWSAGLGTPHRYTFEAVLMNGEGQARASRSATTGLRSVKLVTKPDEHGATFYIELNGVPLFCKGANHIPNDSFVTEVSDERYRHEVASAAESNMNMLRVWGGGIYEQDVFYDLCDEYGILVWQDFMFACSMYPGDEHFLENVRIEAEENIKRLRNHPCIALWCGNNEIDTAWSHYDENAGWGGWKAEYTPELREKIWADYEAIFHRILPDAVSKLAPGAAYWPSSPMQQLSGDKDQHAHNRSARGDIHYWGVWHNTEPFDNYNVCVGRFMSEYGFQSFPEERTVRTFAEAQDMELFSDVMLAHQKNMAGNRLIKEYMDIYMPQPKDFPSFLYMSQVLQAEAMKTAIEAHRRKRPFCMGSLYWQMNDCWPVASWSSMDYYGRWKATQYYARRSFRDVLLSVDGTDRDRVDVYLVSDRLEPVQGTLLVELIDFSGRRLKEWSARVTAEANRAHRVFSLRKEEALSGANPAQALLYARFVRDGSTAMAAAAEHYFVPAKALKLPRPNITMSASGGSAAEFTLTTDTLAKQVWLNTGTEGIFSDNFFDLIPGKPVTVTFYARNKDGQAFAPGDPGEVSVRSMADFIIHS